jgi:hypothetical protein
MSLVASSFAIHNAILAERPDLMPALYGGYRCEHSEAADSGEDAVTAHRVPVFGPLGDKFVCNFHNRPMARALAREDLANEPERLEAFEMFRAMSEREVFIHRMMLEPGDLHFVNNRTVLHGRTEFEDYDGLERKRLLLRLWLSMPDWPDLPAHMKSH